MTANLKAIEFLDGYVIRATLDDGSTRDLDFEGHLWGPMFEPLKCPSTGGKALASELSA